MRKNKKGFSLSEIIITIALIGIILAIAIPSVTIISKKIKVRTWETKKEAIIAVAEKYGKKEEYINHKYIQIQVKNLLIYGLIESDIEYDGKKCVYSYGCIINPITNEIANNDEIQIERNKSITIATWGWGDITAALTVHFNGNGEDINQTDYISGKKGEFIDVLFPEMKIKRNGYEMFGWDIIENGKEDTTILDEDEHGKFTAKVLIEQDKQEITYYAQTYKTLTVTFNYNGACKKGKGATLGIEDPNTGSVNYWEDEKQCNMWNKETNCYIESPSFGKNDSEVQSNYTYFGEIIGWDTEKERRDGKAFHTISGFSVNKNIKYYAIHKYAYKIRFFRKDVEKSNSDYEEIDSKECEIYNTDFTCKINQPSIIIPVIGYYMYGWVNENNKNKFSGTNQESLAYETPMNTEITITKDMYQEKKLYLIEAQKKQYKCYKNKYTCISENPKIFEGDCSNSSTTEAVTKCKSSYSNAECTPKKCQEISYSNKNTYDYQIDYTIRASKDSKYTEYSNCQTEVHRENSNTNLDIKVCNNKYECEGTECTESCFKQNCKENLSDILTQSGNTPNSVSSKCSNVDNVFISSCVTCTSVFFIGGKHNGGKGIYYAPYDSNGDPKYNNKTTIGYDSFDVKDCNIKKTVNVNYINDIITKYGYVAEITETIVQYNTPCLNGYSTKLDKEYLDNGKVYDNCPTGYYPEEVTP